MSRISNTAADLVFEILFAMTDRAPSEHQATPEELGEELSRTLSHTLGVGCFQRELWAARDRLDAKSAEISKKEDIDAFVEGLNEAADLSKGLEDTEQVEHGNAPDETQLNQRKRKRDLFEQLDRKMEEINTLRKRVRFWYERQDEMPTATISASEPVAPMEAVAHIQVASSPAIVDEPSTLHCIQSATEFQECSMTPLGQPGRVPSSQVEASGLEDQTLQPMSRSPSPPCSPKTHNRFAYLFHSPGYDEDSSSPPQSAQKQSPKRPDESSFEHLRRIIRGNSTVNDVLIKRELSGSP